MDLQTLYYEIHKVVRKLKELEQTIKNIESTVSSIQYHQQYKK